MLANQIVTRVSVCGKQCAVPPCYAAARVSVCPKCQCDFPGESFCPHDGSALLSSGTKATILEDADELSDSSGAKATILEDADELSDSSDAKATILEGADELFDSSGAKATILEDADELSGVSPTMLGDPNKVLGVAAAPSVSALHKSFSDRSGGTGTDNLRTHNEVPMDPNKVEPLSTTPVSRLLKQLVEERPERLLGIELEGRYKIERQIGEGGMGVVYLARHSVIEKLVAVKVLRANVATSESVVKRFVQEARAASRIGHPNIIDVTDFGTTADGLTYQVMEYLQGKTLARLLKDEGILSVTRAIFIISQVARALHAAHEKGIIHRDLKPENIFLISRNDSDDFVKIVDFGIAKIVTDTGDGERLTRVGTVIGTPQYMAPEQAAGRADVDARADIYALGIILYEMLSGKVPLEGDTTVRTLAMQMLDEPERLLDVDTTTEVTEELSDVVMGALIKKPSKRFQTMLAFLNALDKATKFTQIDLPAVEVASLDTAETEKRFDTIPETDLGAETEVGVAVTEVGAQSVAARAAEYEDSEPAARARRSTDPLFTQDKSSSISAILPDPTCLAAPEESLPDSASRSSMLIVGVTLFVVAGAVAVYALTRKGEPVVAAAIMGDAGISVDGSGRIGASMPKVLEPKVLEPKVLDAGVPVSQDSGLDMTLKTQVEVRVTTRPINARLMESAKISLGKNEIRIRRTRGTSLTLKCQKDGYLDGTVVLQFDGETSEYICRLKKVRKPRCVEGVMNPFNDCP